MITLIPTMSYECRCRITPREHLITIFKDLLHPLNIAVLKLSPIRLLIVGVKTVGTCDLRAMSTDLYICLNIRSVCPFDTSIGKELDPQEAAIS